MFTPLKNSNKFGFFSPNRTFELALEGTHARKYPNKFGISLAYSYLCRQEKTKACK